MILVEQKYNLLPIEVLEHFDDKLVQPVHGRANVGQCAVFGEFVLAEILGQCAHCYHCYVPKWSKPKSGLDLKKILIHQTKNYFSSIFDPLELMENILKNAASYFRNCLGKKGAKNLNCIRISQYHLDILTLIFTNLTTQKMQKSSIKLELEKNLNLFINYKNYN
ncbi:hypothetical protein BpHYR1_015285 [Brachionus plicatilis]|uniref:Uncharacterized protein n=1 Tax=Brachionus plicatilis TaxID=10195 RepID=A0A3M7QRZ9_BRAPC|nr:hypothetical protein BpHYR1_015285 [Brachionus plicatilis]